ncbi:MAG: hypothetical protein JWR12_1723 [Mucilaginibacter sp.]|nr:hypothetical protein [Mucilaginibacter sp.]
MQKALLLPFFILCVVNVSLGQASSQTEDNSLIYNSSSSSGIYPVFSHTEETKGSRYLFNNWVTGFVVGINDSVYKNSSYGFNYDKIGGGLLLTSDKHSAIEVDKAKIKSFTLNNDGNEGMVFEYVPNIDKVHFVQLIAGGSRYNLYKRTITTFVKNNYHSDGMASTGNNYDEYVDDNTYYVLNKQTNQLQQFSLKKKSIKAVFEGKALDAFFAANNGSIDDKYLKSLGYFVNK